MFDMVDDVLFSAEISAERQKQSNSGKNIFLDILSKKYKDEPINPCTLSAVAKDVQFYIKEVCGEKGVDYRHYSSFDIRDAGLIIGIVPKNLCTAMFLEYGVIISPELMEYEHEGVVYTHQRGKGFLCKFVEIDTQFMSIKKDTEN
jgi:hypothetical protein